MASVGYGLYTYGKSDYGTPVYHFGVATSAQTSGFTAEASVIRYGASVIPGVSDFDSVGTSY